MRWWQYNSWARWYMQRKGMTTKPGQSVAWAGLETTIIWRCCLTHLTKNHAHLVGGIPTPLKNMKVSWDDYPHIWKNKKCSKPPTSHELASSAALRCQRMTAWFSNSPLAVTHSVQASQKKQILGQPRSTRSIHSSFQQNRKATSQSMNNMNAIYLDLPSDYLT